MSANSKTADLKLNKYVSPGNYIPQVIEGNQPARLRQIIISK